MSACETARTAPARVCTCGRRSGVVARPPLMVWRLRRGLRARDRRPRAQETARGRRARLVLQRVSAPAWSSRQRTPAPLDSPSPLRGPAPRSSSSQESEPEKLVPSAQSRPRSRRAVLPLRPCATLLVDIMQKGSIHSARTQAASTARIAWPPQPNGGASAVASEEDAVHAEATRGEEDLRQTRWPPAYRRLLGRSNSGTPDGRRWDRVGKPGVGGPTARCRTWLAMAPMRITSPNEPARIWLRVTPKERATGRDC